MVIVGLLAGGPLGAQGFVCDPQKYCGEMASCAEAVFQLRQCGAARRDRDEDGIPCESICGNTLEAMRQKLQGSDAFTAIPEAAAAFQATSTAGFSCRVRKTCGKMRSCEEARYHLTRCGNRRLDGDGDGVPCASLCKRR